MTHRRTDGRTDGQTDRRTTRNQYAPATSLKLGAQLSETGLLELTKVCNRFNSKGDNFNEKKVQVIAICYPHEKRPNVLQTTLWTINGLSGFVFKTRVH